MAISDFLNAEYRDGYRLGKQLKQNPALAKRYYEQQDASQMAQLADKIYGERGQPEIPDQFNAKQDGMPIEFGVAKPDVAGQVGRQASGLFDPNIPEQDKLQLMNKRMLASGIPGFLQQWQGNQGRMQDSMMQNAAPRAQKQSSGALIADELGLTGIDRINFIRNHAMKSGVNVNVGSGQPSKLNFATPEQVNQLGYAPGTQVMIDKNNKPFLPAAMSELTSKNQNFYDMMDSSEALTEEVLTANPDFSPTDTTDAMLRQIQAGGSTIGSIIAKAQSPASKSYLTAQMNWIAANRGALSGAAVPEVEVARDLQTYYPQADDPDELIEYKKLLRAKRKAAIGRTINLSAEQRRKQLADSADKDFEDVKAKEPLQKPKGWREEWEDEYQKWREANQ